jgi:hypothetical protein
MYAERVKVQNPSQALPLHLVVAVEEQVSRLFAKALSPSSKFVETVTAQVK